MAKIAKTSGIARTVRRCSGLFGGSGFDRGGSAVQRYIVPPVQYH